MIDPRRLAAEPLAQFASVGLLAFGLHAAFAPDGVEVVVVGAEREQALIDGFAARSGRAPTAEEHEALVAGWVDEEIAFREARALHLDDGDPIVRRRLVQKMRFVQESGPEPTEAELAAWLEAHPDRYAIPESFALTQVFFAGDAEAEARAVAAELAAGRAPDGLGDPTPHGPTWGLAPRSRYAEAFGNRFAEAIGTGWKPASTEMGSGWQVLQSDFGWHVVRIDQRVEGRAARLDEVRARVEQDCAAAAAAERAERATSALRERYAVERR